MKSYGKETFIFFVCNKALATGIAQDVSYRDGTGC